MNTMTIDEYKRIRRKNPTLGAKQALLWARGNLKPLAHEWETYGGNLNVARTEFEQDGFTIKVSVDYDEFIGPRYSLTDTKTDIRNPNFRYGAYREEPRYVELESGNTVRELAKWYNKAGESKAVAWQESEKALRDEVKTYLDPAYCEYTIRARAYIEGVEVGEAALSGLESDPYQDTARMADDFLIESDVAGEAIAEARDNMAKIVAAAAKVEAEWASA